MYMYVLLKKSPLAEIFSSKHNLSYFFSLGMGGPRRYKRGLPTDPHLYYIPPATGVDFVLMDIGICDEHVCRSCVVRVCTGRCGVVAVGPL